MALAPEAAASLCRHCRLPLAAVKSSSRFEGFCCEGCRCAFELINSLSLGRFYELSRETEAGALRPQKPSGAALQTAYMAAAALEQQPGPSFKLSFLVEGIHCAACGWVIEHIVGRQEGITAARLNVSTRKLTLSGRKDRTNFQDLLASLGTAGYYAYLYTPPQAEALRRRRRYDLLRSFFVTAAAMMNTLMISIALWADKDGAMPPSLRLFLVGFEAFLTVPAVAYGGRLFFRSAIGNLRAGVLSTDAAISLAVIATTLISLYQGFFGDGPPYFESANMLLCVLLAGRLWEDVIVHNPEETSVLTRWMNPFVRQLLPSGKTVLKAQEDLQPADRLCLFKGEMIPADGLYAVSGPVGEGYVDRSFFDGEARPFPLGRGQKVYRGWIVLSDTFVMEVTSPPQSSFLAKLEVATAEALHKKGKWAHYADRLARLYTPFVLCTGAAAFGLDVFEAGHVGVSAFVRTATVFLALCPCALALAVPLVYGTAVARLKAKGVFWHSLEAMERLARSSWVVFDKTGTLTYPQMRVRSLAVALDRRFMGALIGLARAGHHPVLEALGLFLEKRMAPGFVEVSLEDIRETPGMGIEAWLPEGRIAVGRKDFVAAGTLGSFSETFSQVWVCVPAAAPFCVFLEETPRASAASVVAALRRRGISVALLSGDHESAVKTVAQVCGIEIYKAAQSPSQKALWIRHQQEAGGRVCMVGDGLNDRLALSKADVSLAMETYGGIQEVADGFVKSLQAVVTALDAARRIRIAIFVCLALALVYNLLALGLALGGFLSPLSATILMSLSSVSVLSAGLFFSRRAVGRLAPRDNGTE